MPTIHL